MGASAQLRWIRPAQQVRSVETRQRLMDSAEALIAEKGFADVPVAEIAHETIAFMVQVHRDRIGILREIMGSAHADPEVGARLEEMTAHACLPRMPRRPPDLGDPSAGPEARTDHLKRRGGGWHGAKR